MLASPMGNVLLASEEWSASAVSNVRSTPKRKFGRREETGPATSAREGGGGRLCVVWSERVGGGDLQGHR